MAAVLLLTAPVIQVVVELQVKVMLAEPVFINQECKKLVVVGVVQEVQELMVDLQDH